MDVSMPILWRYLLRSYFQVFALCVSGFIAILLVTRFQEIASFATACGSFSTLFLFILYQIPYILPIAIPISCLIAAILLFQKLSHTHELTAFRSCGLGLKPIATPLILAGLILGMFNFIIASEIGPHCRGLSKQLIYQAAASNPLVLMQKDSLLKTKNLFIDIKTLHSTSKAEDVIIVSKNTSNDRLTLVSAKQLFIDQDQLKGTGVTLISSVDPKKGDSLYDHLVIENQKSMQTKASTLTQPMQTTEWLKSHEYLPLRMIIAKEAVEKNLSTYSIGRSAKVEISKRITLGLAAFTFTFVGIAYGMEIGRQRRKKGTLIAFALAAFFMVCFVSARSMRHSPYISCLIYLLPHPILFLCSLRHLRFVSRGVE